MQLGIVLATNEKSRYQTLATAFKDLLAQSVLPLHSNSIPSTRIKARRGTHLVSQLWDRQKEAALRALWQACRDKIMILSLIGWSGRTAHAPANGPALLHMQTALTGSGVIKTKGRRHEVGRRACGSLGGVEGVRVDMI